MNKTSLEVYYDELFDVQDKIEIVAVEHGLNDVPPKSLHETYLLSYDLAKRFFDIAKELMPNCSHEEIVTEARSLYEDASKATT